MRIAIDAMGGDRAPEEVVKGALAAARDLHVEVILVGEESAIAPFLPTPMPPGVSVHAASQVVAMGEAPTTVRKKKDSSIVVATRLHKEGLADAVLSAGNSGAAAAAALFTLERISGVERPAIATIFPTEKRPTVLLDAGANVDCRPRHLAEFAIMGSAYSRCILGIISKTAGDFFGVSENDVPSQNKPTVGLLSIGEEESKGNELTKSAFKLIQENATCGGYTFQGNVEGRDLGAGNVDVVVCDGFVGNVVLKVAEGLAKMFGGELRRALKSSWRTKIGAIIVKPGLLKFKKRLDYTEFGGAALLGVNGVCIICHGSSDHRSIYSAIRIAKHVVETDVVGTITELMEAATAARLLPDNTQTIAPELSANEQALVPPVNF